MSIKLIFPVKHVATEEVVKIEEITEINESGEKIYVVDDAEEHPAFEDKIGKLDN